MPLVPRLGASYAAPIYLHLRGHPSVPDDLSHHGTLVMRSAAANPAAWTMRGAERWSWHACRRAR